MPPTRSRIGRPPSRPTRPLWRSTLPRPLPPRRGPTSPLLGSTTSNMTLVRPLLPTLLLASRLTSSLPLAFAEPHYSPFRTLYYAFTFHARTAIMDAHKAVEMRPSFSKGYSRQAEAYTALQEFSRAHTACAYSLVGDMPYIESHHLIEARLFPQTPSLSSMPRTKLLQDDSVPPPQRSGSGRRLTRSNWTRRPRVSATLLRSLMPGSRAWKLSRPKDTCRCQGALHISSLPLARPVKRA